MTGTPTRRDVLRAAGATGLAALGAGRAAAAGQDAAARDADGSEERGGAAGGARGDDGKRGDGERGGECAGPRTSDDDLPFDTGGRYGGWGGHEFHGTAAGLAHDPVVFVHGNTRDACDFSKHADVFAERDYGGDALWSITFREETSTHPEMRDQLESFVANVLAYTGADRVDVVAHSLGVTGARYWLDEADRYDSVGTFVGLAGANHGTTVCPTCTAYPGWGEPCQFISPRCAEPGGPLYDLNHPDETPGGIDYYTVRGTADAFYVGRSDSPRLAGAVENVALADADHETVREGDRSVDLQYEWVS